MKVPRCGDPSVVVGGCGGDDVRVAWRTVGAIVARVSVAGPAKDFPLRPAPTDRDRFKVPLGASRPWQYALVTDAGVSPLGLTLLHAANVAFEMRLRRVGPGDWVRPTPCAGWDIRALVNHVVGGNRRFVLLLGGASAEDTNRTREVDHLGGDAVAAFLTTATQLEAAFREDGALSCTVDHRFGERTGAQLLALRVLDMVVYAWDVDQALGVCDTFDPAAIDFALAHADEVERLRVHGVFATPSMPLPADASPLERLLHLTGRRGVAKS